MGLNHAPDGSKWDNIPFIERIHADLLKWRRRKGLMAEFGPAFDFMIQHEGGYVSDPDDPGGETKYGISARSYPNEDIKNLTLDDAKAIYLRDFWLPGYEHLDFQNIANKVFDFAVNMGKASAHKILQKAINSLGGIQITVDGIFGNETIAAVNANNPNNLMQGIRAYADEHYRAIAAANPAEEKFLHGWLARANA